MPNKVLDSHASIQEMIRWACAHSFEIQLPADRLCFLMVIYAMHADQSEGLFSESELADLFQAVQQTFQTKLKKCASQVNSVINDFVSQRLLNRFVGDWIASDAVYRLSALGISIAEQYLKQKSFSTMRFSFQLKQISEALKSIAHSLEAETVGEALNRAVLLPLRYHVSDIFDGIDRAQRMLDLTQSEVKEKIHQLLSKPWGDAIQVCEQLLLETSTVFMEVRDTLEAAGNSLQAQLLALQKTHLAFPKVEGLNALLLAFQHKLDRILQWGENTISLWIQFDKQVHCFIREMLEINKNQQLSLKLSKSIQAFLDQPYGLLYCEIDRLLDYDPRETQPVAGLSIGSVEPIQMVGVFERSASEACDRVARVCLNQFKQGQEAVLNVLRDYLSELPISERPAHLQQIVALLSQWGYARASLKGQATNWAWLDTSRALAVQLHAFDFIKSPD